MNLASNKSDLVFLCKDTKINRTDKTNIILSPEFYWVRIFDLPVKSVSQAKSLLPPLFEDICQDVDNLSYQVIKLENDKFLCFAYENKKIFDTIKNSGINLSLVNGIYFAQNECEGLQSFFIKEKAFSYTQDGILVKIPKNLLENAVDMEEEIHKINLSSHKVNIKLYNNLLNNKQIVPIIVICCVFILINLFKIVDYSNQISTYEEKIVKIKENSKLPKSILQVNSIIKAYEKDIKQEIKKREAIEYIFEKKEFTLSNLEIDKDTINLNFNNTNKDKIESYLKKKYTILSSNIVDSKLIIRIKI